MGSESVPCHKVDIAVDPAISEAEDIDVWLIFAAQPTDTSEDGNPARFSANHLFCSIEK